MKKILLLSAVNVFLQFGLFAQFPNKSDVFTKANNTVNKVHTILTIFQPYMLKAEPLSLKPLILAATLPYTIQKIHKLTAKT